MRIAILCDLQGWAWAGCEEIWLAFAEAARRENHEVFVFLNRLEISPGPLRRLQACGVQLRYPQGLAGISERARRFSWKLSFAADTLFPRFAEVERLAPDFVLINLGDQIPAGNFLRQAQNARVLQFPYFTITHNSHLSSPPPARAEREAVAALYAGARCSFFTAHRTWHEVEHVLAAKIEPVRIVRNPVNLEALGPVPMPSGPTLRLAMVGRVAINAKGHDVLAATLSAPAWKDRDYLVSVYGDGPHRETVEALAAHYGVADRFRFAGFAADVRKIWAENHILVLPSRNESSPLVLVEAMLCGRPAVVTDVGGVCEWASEPETGFISESAGVHHFGDALERAWQARGEWPAMGERARQRALRQIEPDPGGALLHLIEGELRGPSSAA